MWLYINGYDKIDLQILTETVTKWKQNKENKEMAIFDVIGAFKG